MESNADFAANRLAQGWQPGDKVGRSAKMADARASWKYNERFGEHLRRKVLDFLSPHIYPNSHLH